MHGIVLRRKTTNEEHPEVVRMHVVDEEIEEVVVVGIINEMHLADFKLNEDEDVDVAVDEHDREDVARRKRKLI